MGIFERFRAVFGLPAVHSDYADDWNDFRPGDYVTPEETSQDVYKVSDYATPPPDSVETRLAALEVQMQSAADHAVLSSEAHVRAAKDLAVVVRYLKEHGGWQFNELMWEDKPKLYVDWTAADMTMDEKKGDETD